MTKQERVARMEALVAKAEAEKRPMTNDEQTEFNGHDEQCRLPEGEVRTIGTPPALHLKKREYSLGRVLRALNGDRMVDVGLETETHKEMERTQKVKEGGILVPLTAFVSKAQDGTSTSPNTGQALVGEDRRGDLMLQIDDAILRPPVAQRLGVTMISTNEDKVIIPRQKKALVASWIARDGSASASTDAEFDSVSLQPTTLALLFEMRRSLVYGLHPDAEAILMSDARRAIDLALDTAVLAGTGASNQPLGFSGTGGHTATGVVGAISDSNAQTHPKLILDELQTYLKDADPAIKWVLHPLMVAMLRMAPAFSGSTGATVIAPDSTLLEGREFIETYALGNPAGGPPAVAPGLVGRFDEMVCCTFGPAMELVVNGFAETQFAKGAVLVRGLLDYGQLHRDIKKVRKFTSEGI